MKRIKRTIHRMKKKGSDPASGQSSTSSSPVSKSPFPSAPLFGLDTYNSPFTSLLTPDELRIIYTCSIHIRSNLPFQDFPDALSALSNWDIKYHGFLGRKPFYRAILIKTSKHLKLTSSGTSRPSYFEYNSTLRGQGIIHHLLGTLPKISSTSETFSQAWDTQRNHGTLKISISLGVTDSTRPLDPILDSSLFKSDKEATELARRMGLDLIKGNDQKWLISHSY
ncbi:matrix protein [Mejal virus]|uniref:matrix protein n=1 Tax=Mejal virus TaxID=2838395 RepID=UPI002481EE0C|nr:matrix protein [Mejal virus]WDX47926.1 matrix protein [Mejal virus]